MPVAQKTIAFRADASLKGSFAGLAENVAIDTVQSLDEFRTKPTFECQPERLLTPLGPRTARSYRPGVRRLVRRIAAAARWRLSLRYRLATMMGPFVEMH
ncbi:hypothetical protein [Paraburkholderia lacunae]|uniref:Uncharacterized protein n=1 Tax=Paraburkholderia lacunae TaxID=2211104 RepID=A0A370N252_9BURK|nr:hypothetical protein [Paraburkholderia lacunae]RDJ99698.1 hypothetical protein DLM46_26350 [Paraburkholderia lacunae]